jgi:hypothetical protein
VGGDLEVACSVCDDLEVVACDDLEAAACDDLEAAHEDLAAGGSAPPDNFEGTGSVPDELEAVEGVGGLANNRVGQEKGTRTVEGWGQSKKVFQVSKHDGRIE